MTTHVSKAVLPVEKNGGMSVEGIHLAIADNEKKQEEKWASRMEQHTEKIDKRLAAHEEKVDSKLDKVMTQMSDLVHLVRNSEEGRTLWQQKMENKQDDWHEKDLQYRESVLAWKEEQDPKIEELTKTVKSNQAALDIAVPKVDKIVVDVATISLRQDDINTKVNMMQWFIMLCKGFVTSKDAVIDAAESGKRLTSSIAAVMATISTLWLFFHNMLPAIKIWLAAHNQ